MPELLLAFVANANAGKSDAIKHVATKYCLPVASGSVVIQAMACERGERLVARENFATFQKRMRDEVSPTFFMDIALQSRDGSGLVVDGLRNFNDYELFQSVGGITVAMWCPIEDRFERGLERGSPKDAAELEAFARAEAPEYDDPDPRGIHILPIMQMADYSIDATKPQPVVFAAIDRITDELTAR